MTDQISDQMDRNIRLYPWFRFLQNLSFWQAVWFLFFQDRLSAAEAILLYAVFDLSMTVLEVPSGYFSDRVGRRSTLLISAAAGMAGATIFALADGFYLFVFGQFLFGVSGAFVSGTDSSILFESLSRNGRKDEVEAQELRAWRFGFAGLAASAVTGGAIALYSFESTFALSALAMAGSFVVALMMIEPPRDAAAQVSEAIRFQHLGEAFRQPVLVWLFALSVLMYGYSHIPFVFGQPFILLTLEDFGLAGEAPFVSGAVTTVMMLVSVLASLTVPYVRKKLGLASILLSAFALQIGLALVLSISGSVFAIAVLFLRMVPSSFSGPLLLARIQPLLDDDSRATFLSIKSLGGRLLFAASLWVSAQATTDLGAMSLPEIQTVLGWYAVAGIAALVVLSVLAMRISVGGPERGVES